MDSPDWTLATCSFSEFTPDMGHPVRVSIGFPRYALRYPLKTTFAPFTPRKDYLYVKSDEVFYRKLREQIENVGLASLENQLSIIAAVNDADVLVMLCFEKLSKPGADCHRTFVRRWWEATTGQPVPELGATRPPEPEPDMNQPLF